MFCQGIVPKAAIAGVNDPAGLTQRWTRSIMECALKHNYSHVRFQLSHTLASEPQLKMTVQNSGHVQYSQTADMQLTAFLSLAACVPLKLHMPMCAEVAVSLQGPPTAHKMPSAPTQDASAA
jgi:hypothetical protein